jgi:hypothetical protein
MTPDASVNGQQPPIRCPTLPNRPQSDLIRDRPKSPNHQQVIGLTIINAKWLLERDHAINVTVPEHVAIGPDALAEALAAA